MSKIHIIFIISFVFFSLTPRPAGQSHFSFGHKGFLCVEKYLKKIESHRAIRLKNHQSRALWRAYIWGKSRHLPKSIKLTHQELHLQHLYSPSGLHLSLLQFFTPKKIFPLFLIAAFSLPALLALKRMALIKFTQLALQSYSFWIFLSCMAFELILNRGIPSLSFCYSFIFLGIIYGRREWYFYSLLPWMLLASFFCQVMIGEHFSPVGFLLGQVIMICFAPLFILQAIFTIAPFDFFILNYDFFCSCYVKILKSLGKLALFFPKIPPSLILFLLIYGLNIPNLRKKILLTLAFYPWAVF